jgi:DNA-binding NarL/FixJ family response regulator
MAKPVAPTPKAPAAIRVAIIHAQPYTRAGVATCLAREEGIEVVGSSPELSSLLAQLEREQPGILIVDEPTVNWLFDQQQTPPMARLVHPPALLLLTEGRPTAIIDHALQVNVRGFVEQADSPAILAQAVRRVAAGESYLAPHLLPRVMGRSDARLPGYADIEKELSPRELEVLRLTGQGLEAKEIAYQLNISSRTVDVHRGNIRTKLGLDGMHTLMRYALVWEQSRARANRLTSFCAETRPLLLVEDDEVDVLSVKRTLSQLRATMPLHVARNGEEALAWLRSGHHPPPFMILLDINMPRMNGHEFMSELRKDPAHASTPVVVLTTSQHDSDRARLFKQGITAYLVKPSTGGECVEMFRSLADFWGFNTPPPAAGAPPPTPPPVPKPRV